jgi:hypothetical protein
LVIQGPCESSELYCTLFIGKFKIKVNLILESCPHDSVHLREKGYSAIALAIKNIIMGSEADDNAADQSVSEPGKRVRTQSIGAGRGGTGGFLGRGGGPGPLLIRGRGAVGGLWRG